MSSLLTQRLQIYARVDAAQDSDVDTPSYVYQTTAWGRVVSRGTVRDVAIGTAARPERSASILFRETTPMSDGAMVVDPATGDQWRVSGLDRLDSMRIIRYAAEFVPGTPLTVGVGTVV